MSGIGREKKKKKKGKKQKHYFNERTNKIGDFALTFQL